MNGPIMLLAHEDTSDRC